MFDLRFEILNDYSGLFLHGLWMTIVVTSVSLVLGAIFGFLLSLIRVFPAPKHNLAGNIALKISQGFTIAYVTFFRGTPLFVQILLIHFALLPVFVSPYDGLLISGDLARYLLQNHGALLSGILALTLNSTAYLAEIYRGGIRSIDLIQQQASYSLGLSYGQSMRYIILPQAVRRMLPSFTNEAIMLLKDSSLVSAVGLAELAYAARTVSGTYLRYWEPYLFISLIYLCLTLMLSLLARYFEKKVNY